MDRRDFLKASSAYLVSSSLLPSRSCAERVEGDDRPHRPNILWISCEDASPDLGCYGDDYADTPNLDRLAAEGCRYTNAFVPYPVCAPTRSSIITGMYPSTIGSMHMRTNLRGYETVPPAYVKCFSEYLRASGYYCTNHTKTDYQFTTPFTAWDKGRDWRDRPGDMPFFSVINLTVSHESRNWPKENEEIIHDPAKVSVPPYYPDTPIVRQNLARYYDNVTRMDKQAGEILQRLEADGLSDSTIVFFWSDHGRGLPRHKRWCYDSGIHVPLIVRWPGGIEPNSVCDDLISLVDLGPTVLSLTSVDVPSYMQGRPFLGGQKRQPRKFIVAGRERMDKDSYDHIRCIRDKRYKYIRNFMPEKAYAQPIPYRDKMPIMQEWRRLNDQGVLRGAQKLFFQNTKPDEELYDTLNDPHEITNLIDAPEHAERIAKMRAQLREWSVRTGDLGGTPEEELIERMWPGRRQPVTAVPTVTITSKPKRAAIHCATEGASIGYRVDKNDPWQLYSKPIPLNGISMLQAKAIRIGYKESRTTRVRLK
ncbi:MAG: sulfatase-like hydrolase/transferase [Phycisphaerales bacterium]|nr:MAG: sulfatase-like hydrolase/transferase [Phycisphaerales bacterium]